MVISQHQNHSLLIASKPFENVAKFKYLGITVTNQNWIHEEIRSRFNSGNACYHSVLSLLPSCLLSNNLKIKIYNNFICCSVWVWNLVSHTKRGAQIEGVWEQGAEENIWTYEGESGGRLEKTS
jgi:hypothetical protein